MKLRLIIPWFPCFSINIGIDPSEIRIQTTVQRAHGSHEITRFWPFHPPDSTSSPRDQTLLALKRPSPDAQRMLDDKISETGFLQRTSGFIRRWTLFVCFIPISLVKALVASHDSGMFGRGRGWICIQSVRSKVWRLGMHVRLTPSPSFLLLKH